MPVYKGAGTKESVLRFVATNIADFIKKKRLMLEDTEKEYQKILQIQPVPPPRWVIASASRVGYDGHGMTDGTLLVAFRAR